MNKYRTVSDISKPKRIPVAFFLSLLFFSLNAFGAKKDTIPPTGKIIGPSNWDVFSSNAIRIIAEATDKESGVKKIRFFAVYMDINRNKFISTEIGVDSIAPFEVVWDCSAVSDQSGGNLSFWCDIYDSAGNIFKTDNVHAVLDRHKEIPTQHMVSFYTKEHMTIDGMLEKEWLKQAPLEMQNGDNKYQFYSCWDDVHLYLALKAKDRKIISDFKKQMPEYNNWDSTALDSGDFRIWSGDLVQFLFSPNNNRTSLLSPKEKLIYLSPYGVFQAFSINMFKGFEIYSFGKNIQCSSRVHVADTTNKLKNNDSYEMELSIPWSSLGVSPKQGYTMGFDIYLGDKETLESNGIFVTWCCQPNGHLNPSEWGNLVLEKKGLNYVKVGIISILVLIAGIVSLLLFHRRKPKGAASIPEINYTSQQKIVRKAEEYLHENYRDPSLNREKLALSLNISSVYLGKIFKKNTEKTLPEYLNELRIKQAEGLLKNTAKNATEIALEVGFYSLEHFFRTFKDITGYTPTEFRKNNQNPQ